MAHTKSSDKPLIHRLETTSDCLTGRAGLVFFSRYLRNIAVLPELDRVFGSIRKSSKGLPVADLFTRACASSSRAPAVTLRASMR